MAVALSTLGVTGGYTLAPLLSARQATGCNSALSVKGFQFRFLDKLDKAETTKSFKVFPRRRYLLPRRTLIAAAQADSVSQQTVSETPSEQGESPYKKILLPIVDRNAYLNEGTRQAVATATSLAKRFNSEITVVVIDETEKDQNAEHDQKVTNIRWHLSQGGFEEFALLERLGDGKMPAAVVGEIADEMNHDLVVLSMETIHSKHIDANLLAEFVPCPVFMVPL